MVALVAACSCSPSEPRSGGDPLSWLAKRITSTSTPDSTAVLVVFDGKLLNDLRARLPRTIAVVPFPQSAASAQEALSATRVGQMFREAATATTNYTDV